MHIIFFIVLANNIQDVVHVLFVTSVKGYTDVDGALYVYTVLCIQTVELVLFNIFIHNSAILQAIHTKYITK